MVAKLKVNTIETVNGDGSITFNNPVNAQFPGKVLQTIEMVPPAVRGITSYPTTTSTTFVNSGLYVDITPMYSNSIIRITSQIVVYNNGAYTLLTIYRGTSTTWNQINLADPYFEATSSTNNMAPLSASHNATHYNTQTMDVLDTPNTINPIRYTVGFLSNSSSYTSYLGWNSTQQGRYKNGMNMIVQEIGQ